MPEGPSIIIAKEKLEIFTGKKIIAASGSAGVDMKRLEGKKIIRMTSWGKHLLFCFDGFTVRIHFLMFGTYFINSSKKLKPKLSLQFAGRQEMNIYTSAIKMFEGAPEDMYDMSADIMNDKWSPAKARKRLKAVPDLLIVDALMDQDIFSGVGNIIKNEALFRARIHPESKIGKIPTAPMTKLMKEVRNYAFEFLEWRKKGQLAKHWEVYTKKKCPRDGDIIEKGYPGKSKRRTYQCNTCQIKYD
jgi:endonuclease VIII